MANEREVKIYLEHGAKWPFDAPDDWWKDDSSVPPPATDWAHRAARGVLANLGDRRGIKQELSGIDEEVRTEVVDTLAAIIRAANSQPRT